VEALVAHIADNVLPELLADAVVEDSAQRHASAALDELSSDQLADLLARELSDPGPGAAP
jgi:hypothetical protein